MFNMYPIFVKCLHIRTFRNRDRIPYFFAFFLSFVSCASAAAEQSFPDARLAELGRAIFEDVSLSRDGRTSCASCHSSSHAFADTRPGSIGTDGQTGTRNAPGLIGASDEESFFWDGRRTRLEDAVLDPFTNPVELGLDSTDELLARIKRNRNRVAQFHAVFPKASDTPTLPQVGAALAAFVRSLDRQTSTYDRAQKTGAPLSRQAELGRQLFEGTAGCGVCHAGTRFSDGLYHFSDVGQKIRASHFGELTQAIANEAPSAAQVGPRVLSDAAWSAFGRFVVTRKPADIGAFRTPSLRNVALTAPYMHDGSIETLSEAVDHEIYYHGSSRGRPISLSSAERAAIVAFLESLSDVEQK